MSRNRTAGLPRQDRARVTAAEWFAGGQRIWYDPESPRVLSEEEAATVALYVGGSDEDLYEHRQIQAARERVPGAEVLTFPGGHLTTSEHPDLLAAAIRDITARHGVSTTATASR